MSRERDLFANFERMRREIDELFGDVFERTGLSQRRAFTPEVDVYYCGKPARAIVKVAIAGIDPDEVSLEVRGREVVIAGRSALDSAEMERRNPNYVGGDINGGLQSLSQLFTRPVARPVPYSTPLRGVYLCSSSTPPGGGVHGMSGYWAARAALRRSYSRSP